MSCLHATHGGPKITGRQVHGAEMVCRVVVWRVGIEDPAGQLDHTRIRHLCMGVLCLFRVEPVRFDARQCGVQPGARSLDVEILLAALARHDGR